MNRNIHTKFRPSPLQKNRSKSFCRKDSSNFHVQFGSIKLFQDQLNTAVETVRIRPKIEWVCIWIRRKRERRAISAVSRLCPKISRTRFDGFTRSYCCFTRHYRSRVRTRLSHAFVSFAEKTHLRIKRALKSLGVHAHFFSERRPQRPPAPVVNNQISSSGHSTIRVCDIVNNNTRSVPRLCKHAYCLRMKSQQSHAERTINSINCRHVIESESIETQRFPYSATRHANNIRTS